MRLALALLVSLMIKATVVVSHLIAEFNFSRQTEADTMSQIPAKVAKPLSSPMALPMDRMGWEMEYSKAVSL